MTTTILLIRHGETDWNTERRRQGHDGPGLNDQGRADAQAAARALLTRPGRPAALYSSDLARAYQTAAIIGETLSLPVHSDPRLRERHQGAWQGRLTDEVAVSDREAFAFMEADPLRGGPPGGETGRQVIDRMAAALDDIAGRHPGAEVVVVSHGGAISLVRWLVEGGLDPAFLRGPGWQAWVQNGEVIVLRWPPG